MTVDLYAVGSCSTCSTGGSALTYLKSLQSTYGFTLVTHNVQLYGERQKAEQYRSAFPEGQFYFPLTVVNGVAKVCGYKQEEIENAIKDGVGE